FTREQQGQIAKILTRPEKQISVVSPSGYFRVHYDTTGFDKPAYDINELLVALDSVYNFEVNFLKYKAPPSDGTVGGDSKYDVYVNDLRGASYGSTQLEDLLAGNKYTSYMIIDNAYLGYNTPGIDGARVTVAHEFHHAIQIGSYIYRVADNPFYEMTSTSMEDFVYNSINDYFNYLSDYFNFPDRNIYGYEGYSLGIWNIYLKLRFDDYDIIRKQWELMPQMRALDAIEQSLISYGSNYKHELNQFGVWCYFTNYRAVSGKYFPEAKYYPVIRPVATLKLINRSLTTNLSSEAAANSYFCIKDSTTNDSLFVVATNSNVRTAVDSSASYIPFAYTASRDSSYGSVRLSSNLFANFQYSDPYHWTVAEILNRQIVRQDNTSNPSTTHVIGDYPFPNPFYYSKNYGGGNFICLPASKTLSGFASLNVYSSGMDLMYSSKMQVVQFPGTTDKFVVQWDGKTLTGKKLASGVYVYIVKSDNNNSKGRLVIFNGK
ncbi:MAG: hypothetical protein Q8903_10595, partial [Bacteroidota bacterium]|nr:hypothetical protein [Bacteroidota bacterium]